MSRLYVPHSCYHPQRFAAVPLPERCGNSPVPTTHDPDADMKRHEPAEAWVVFSGEADVWWLKMLKPGFRHCFAVARDDTNWIVIDPLSPHLELAVLPLPRDFDVPQWLQSQGMRVIRAPINRHKKTAAPLHWFSCVEVIKRFLGIHSRSIVTPWQLYRFLHTEQYSS